MRCDLQQFEVVHGPSECTLSIRGVINENTDFSQIDLKSAKLVYLDLKEVKTLNSMGLRNWVLWVKQIKDSTQMIVRHCPRTVVDQMNILHGFLPMGAVVESFFIPYTCSSCQHEENYLAIRGRDYKEGTVDSKEGASILNTRPCVKCKETMEMDVVPARYFNFLKYRRI